MVHDNRGVAASADLLKIQDHIIQAVNTGSNKSSIAQALTQSCLEFPCLQSAWLWTFQKKTGTIKLAGTAGVSPSVSRILENFSNSTTVATHLMLGHEVVVDWEEIWEDNSQVFFDSNLQRVGVLPLKSDTGLICALGFASGSGEVFDPRLLAVLRQALHYYGLRLEIMERDECLAGIRLNMEEVLTALDDSLFVVNRDGKILSTNVPIDGEKAEHVDIDLILPGGLQILQQYHDDLPTRKIVGGSSLKQSRLKKSNGHLVPVDVSVKTGFWDGRQAYFMSCRDITQQLVIEKERDRLVTAIEQTADSIIITNSSGSIQYTNPAFSKLTGYSADEVLGANPRILKSSRHDHEFYRQMWSTIRRGEIWKGRMVNCKKSGEEYCEVATISPVLDSNGIITHFVGVRQDVTNEQKLEERLRQSQKMEAIGTLAGGIAHDFNNILYALLGNSQLALDDIPEDHPAHLPLIEIVKAGDRGSALVSKMLAFGQRAEGQMKVCALGPIITEVMKLTRASLPSTIEIKLELTEDCPDMLLDETQIHQVILNLCTNAAHAMRDGGGVLLLNLEQATIKEDTPEYILGVVSGDYLRLKVSDTGTGMDSAVLDRIFEPYFTTKKANEGTGLGLASVHGIVSNHEGRVFVDSSPNEGTTFTFYFPVAKENSVPEKVETGKENELTGHCRVMVVDDESMITDLVVRGLQKKGFQVVGFTDGIAALEVFRKNPDAFDVVITDQTMPIITGFELAAHLSSIRPDLPIILSTGYANTVNESELRTAGVSHFLSKPMKINELAALLCEINEKAVTIKGV